MKKMSLAFIAIVGFAMSFTSCSKDRTITNEVNNAYSDFLQVAPQDWQISSDGNNFQIAYDASSVPNGFVYNTDGVLIYASNTNDDNSVYSPLPLTTATLDNFYVDYYMANNTIVLELIPANGAKATNANAPTTNFYFNLVFIQPQDITSSNVNMKDFNAVKAAYHLK